MVKYKVTCSLDFGSVFLHLFMWAMLSLVTFGIAIFFFPYYLVKLVVNHIEIDEIEAKNEEEMKKEPEEQIDDQAELKDLIEKIKRTTPT